MFSDVVGVAVSNPTAHWARVVIKGARSKRTPSGVVVSATEDAPISIAPGQRRVVTHHIGLAAKDVSSTLYDPVSKSVSCALHCCISTMLARHVDSMRPAERP